MEHYNDPTAWTAIANVEMERRREAQKHEEPQKKEYERQPPVDPLMVIHAKNKRVNINRAWLFTYKFKKANEDKT